MYEVRSLRGHPVNISDARRFPLARPGTPFAFLLLLSLCGCATSRTGVQPAARPFDFQKDTFAYPNELLWIYHFEPDGKWTSEKRHPKPTYWLRCFVVARSARQFFLNARFDPQQPIADEQTYQKLIQRVVHSSPRHPLPESKKIVIPGFACLREFSLAQEGLLKAECGSGLESYFQRGHWRMVFPFSRQHQEHMAERLMAEMKQNQVAVVHLSRFPQLTINHAVVLFEAHELPTDIRFTTYDPNSPAQPTTLTFDRATRTFTFPANNYFAGGHVDAYEVYCSWDY